MIKTIYVPLSAKIPQPEKMFMAANGELDEFRSKLAAAREQAERELNILLNNDWRIIHNSQSDTDRGIDAIFILYKSDHEIAFSQAWGAEN